MVPIDYLLQPSAPEGEALASQHPIYDLPNYDSGRCTPSIAGFLNLKKYYNSIIIMLFFPRYDPAPAPTEASMLKIRQGKVAELRLELNSGGKKEKNHGIKKIALKKIVANMTMSNNDMVALFPDIIGCMHIQSLEIKKM